MRSTRSILALLAPTLAVAPLSAQDAAPGTRLPARFEANRIHVHPVTATGDTLRLYTDTGGSYYLYAEAVERLGLPTRDTTVGGRTGELTVFPEIARPTSFPRVRGRPPLVRTRRPIDERMSPRADGMLGQAWFAGRVWNLDYPAGEMTVRGPSADPPAEPEHTLRMGFATDAEGRRRAHFPSIEAEISGETHPFLLDTGATALLSEEGRAALGGPGVRGTSYVVASVFARWREEHPDWRVVEEASVYPGRPPMIRVPRVTVAGHTVGPVWFVRRPDRNFHQRMAQWMDRPVDGALGGSLFRYFVLTLDYPDARAHFRRAGAARTGEG